MGWLDYGFLNEGWCKRTTNCEERGIKIWDLKAEIRWARDAGLVSKTGRSATDGRSAFVPVIVTKERLSGVPYCEI